MDQVEMVGTGMSIADRVESVLGAIAQKLGQGVEHFWPVFIRQQAVEAITALMLVVIGLIAGTLIFRVGVKTYKASNGTEFNPDYKMVLGIIGMIMGGLALLIASIGLCAEASNVVTGLINPEYAAVRDVVQMVQGVGR